MNTTTLVNNDIQHTYISNPVPAHGHTVLFCSRINRPFDFPHIVWKQGQPCESLIALAEHSDADCIINLLCMGRASACVVVNLCLSVGMDGWHWHEMGDEEPKKETGVDLHVCDYSLVHRFIAGFQISRILD